MFQKNLIGILQTSYCHIADINPDFPHSIFRVRQPLFSSDDLLKYQDRRPSRCSLPGALEHEWMMLFLLFLGNNNPNWLIWTLGIMIFPLWLRMLSLTHLFQRGWNMLKPPISAILSCLASEWRSRSASHWPTSPTFGPSDFLRCAGPHLCPSCWVPWGPSGND